MDNNSKIIDDYLISKSFLTADYVTTHHNMVARTLERITQKKEHGLRTPDELWIVDHNDVYTLGQAGKEAHILQHTDTPIIKTDRGGQVTWHGHGQLVLYWLFDLDSLGWSVRNLVSHAEQAIEDVVNDCLDQYLRDKNMASNISAYARRDAPGIYLYSTPMNSKLINSTPINHNQNTMSNGTVASDFMLTDYAHHDDIDGATDNSVRNDNEAINLINTTARLPSDAAVMIGKIASLGFKIKHGFSYHGIALNINCDLSAFNAINPCGYAGMQMLRLADFVTIEDISRDDISSDALSYQSVTQKLLHNIAKRHAGLIKLRAVAPKL